MSRVAGVIKPKVKVHWALNASPRCNKKKKKKPFPHGTPGKKGPGWVRKDGPAERSHQSTQLPPWMPFTFSGIHSRSESSTWQTENLKRDLKSSALPSLWSPVLCNTPDDWSVFAKCSPTHPKYIHFIGFSVFPQHAIRHVIRLGEWIIKWLLSIN